MKRFPSVGLQAGLVLGVLVLCSSNGRGTVLEPEFVVSAKPPAGGLTPGQPTEIELRIYVRGDQQLGEISLENRGEWTQAKMDRLPVSAKPLPAPPGYRLERRILRGEPDQALSQVTLSVELNGVRVLEPLRFSVGSDRSQAPESIDAGRAPRLDATRFRRIEPAPSGLPGAPRPVGKALQTVQVSGRVMLETPSGATYGADNATVRVLKPETFDDSVLAETTTDVNGDYSFEFTADESTDFYIRWEARNHAVTVGTDVFFSVHARSSGTLRVGDVAGPLALGGHLFPGEMNQALWVMTALTRAHRWFGDMGYDVEPVNCRWPDDSGATSWYTPTEGLKGIHLRSMDAWNSGTLLHEYGHHFVQGHAAQVSPPHYCNDMCEPGVCGHCMWCVENEAVAWSEGFPHFLAYAIAADHDPTYGWGMPNATFLESLALCGQTGTLHVSRSVEGAFAAFLQDLVDSNSDADPMITSGAIQEFSNLPVADVLTVATTFRPSDSLQFVAEMRGWLLFDSPYGPTEMSEFWAAALMNGFETVDNDPPSPPTQVTSTTHPVGSLVPANMPQLSFTGGADDHSGLVGYCVLITEDPAENPNCISGLVGGPSSLFVETTGTGSLVWPVALPPGTYYANVASVDRAGIYSSPFSYGPFSVGTPTPADLILTTEHFWEGPVVARHAPDATPTVVPKPAELVGGVDLWLNALVKNDSPTSHPSAPVLARFFVDDDFAADESIAVGILAGNMELPFINVGPTQVRGGRHQFRVHLDPAGAIPEAGTEGEANNRFDMQLVVRPQVFSANVWKDEVVGPRTQAVFTQNPTSFPNCNGYRLVPANQYAAFLEVSSQADYYLQLHLPSQGLTRGFETPLAESRRGPRVLDGIVFNAAALGQASYDAGVVREQDTFADGYAVQLVDSQVVAPGGDATTNWSAHDRMSLYEFSFDILQAGPFGVSLQADVDPADPAPVRLVWIEDGTASWSPGETATATTDDTGFATFTTTATVGTHCLVVYRDAPRGVGPGALMYSISTTEVPAPDLTPQTELAFWDAPILPSPAPIIDAAKVEFPTDLVGEGMGTYLNFAVRNLGVVEAVSTPVEILLDGNSLYSFDFQQMQGGKDGKFIASTPVAVPGGRHTLCMSIDPFDQVSEANETNNVFALQWGWSGADLIAGQSHSRPAPPDPVAGLDDVIIQYRANPAPNGEGALEVPINFAVPNADGLHLPQSASKSSSPGWTGVVAMPGVSSNVDLRLHRGGLPPAQRFVHALVESTWEAGQSDFVLIDHNSAAPADYDVGIVNSGGSESYTIHSISSFPLGNFVDGTSYGPIIFYPGFALGLFEMPLEPGSYEVKVTTVPGAEIGVSVHGPPSVHPSPYHAKSELRAGVPGQWELPGTQQNVSFDVRAGEDGLYCFAVWREDDATLGAELEFSLEVAGAEAPPLAIVLDGTAEAAYGTPRSIQSVQTAFQDSDLGLAGTANGSELDGLFARIDQGVLFLTLAGNLESHQQHLEIFFDVHQGGQNRLLGNNATVSGNALNRMGDDGSGNGFTFDAGFEPDYYLSLTGGGVEYVMTAHWAELPSGGGGVGRFLGATTAASTGRLLGAGADNPDDIRVTIDNSNTGGVDAGTAASSGAGVVTGVEFAIPLTALGDPECFRLVAFINGADHGFVSNQMLGPLPVGTGNLGEPRSVDLTSIAGDQWVMICPSTVTAVDDSPRLRETGFVLDPPVPNPFNPRTTIAFTLRDPSVVRIGVYDVAGRLVTRLIDGALLPAGVHERLWDGTDRRGARVASGAYLVRMSAGGRDQVQRVTLLK